MYSYETRAVAYTNFFVRIISCPLSCSEWQKCGCFFRFWWHHGEQHFLEISAAATLRRRHSWGRSMFTAPEPCWVSDHCSSRTLLPGTQEAASSIFRGAWQSQVGSETKQTPALNSAQSGKISKLQANCTAFNICCCLQCWCSGLVLRVIALYITQNTGSSEHEAWRWTAALGSWESKAKTRVFGCFIHLVVYISGKQTLDISSFWTQQHFHLHRNRYRYLPDAFWIPQLQVSVVQIARAAVVFPSKSLCLFQLHPGAAAGPRVGSAAARRGLVRHDRAACEEGTKSPLTPTDFNNLRTEVSKDMYAFCPFSNRRSILQWQILTLPKTGLMRLISWNLSKKMATPLLWKFRRKTTSPSICEYFRSVGFYAKDYARRNVLVFTQNWSESVDHRPCSFAHVSTHSLFPAHFRM